MKALTDEPLPCPAARPSLRLVAAPPSAPPYDDEPGTAPTLRLVGAPIKTVPFNDQDWLASERTPAALLPAAQGFARVVLQAVLEVAAGVRPLKQLQAETSTELYNRLVERLSARPRATGLRPDRGAIQTVHVQLRPEGIAEVCARVQHQGCMIAMALRIEGLDGRWKCTELVGV